MKALVKYFHLYEPKNIITSFYSDNVSDFLKSIKIMKDNEIRCSFNEFSEEIEQEWKGWSFLINNVKVTLPSNTDLFVIEIEISDAVEE